MLSLQLSHGHRLIVHVRFMSTSSSTLEVPTRLMRALRPALRRLVLCILCAQFVVGSAGAAEYEAPAVKAAFLHRFGSYVEWPRGSLGDGTPFTIGVLDDFQVVSHLERLLPGLKIHNRPAQVRSLSSIGEIDDVHILYIGPTQAARAKSIAAALAGRPVLVVTDVTDGLDLGGIINFVAVGRNVRFEVSLPAAKRHGLKIDSGLLSVAVRVEQGPRGKTLAPDDESQFASVLTAWTLNPTRDRRDLARITTR